MPLLPMAPWRLSGVVVTALLNDPASLAALGAAASAPPYQAPPRAPVLGVKPPQSQRWRGGDLTLPPGAEALCVGATLGLVIGRTACRVPAAHALEHVAGWTLVGDFFVPHDSHYRPAVALHALDGSCWLGPVVLPRHAVAEPDALVLQVQVGAQPERAVAMAASVRPVASLLQDVTAFMTLHPGDVLTLGVRHAAPVAAGGEAVRVSHPLFGALEGRVLPAHGAAATGKQERPS